MVKVENNTVVFHGKTYPLKHDASLKDKAAIAIAPIFFMLAISFAGYARSNISPVVCEEANSADYYSLILLISNLCGTIMSPVVGRLGDILGRKRLSLICLVPFIGSLILTGVAQGPLVLGIGFGLLGLFYTSLNAVTNGLIIDVFDQATRTRFLSYINSANAVAAMLGPQLVGLLADNIGAQRAMMSLSVLLGIAWLLMMFTYPDIRYVGRNVSLDVSGMILLPLAIGPVMIALSTGGNQLAWSSPWIIGMFICSLVFCVIFYKVEGKKELPVVNFKMLSNRVVLPQLFNMFFMSSMSGLAIYLTLYGREVMGYSATELGTLQFFAWVPAVVTPIIGIYLSKTNNFKLIFSVSGIMHVVCGLSYFFLLEPGLPAFATAAIKIPQFIAACTVISPMFAYIGGQLSPKERGMGIALISFFSTLGTSLFTAIYAMIFNLFPEGIKDAFPVLCLITGAIGVIRLTIALTCTRKISADDSPVV